MSCNLIKKVKGLVLCINNTQTNMRTGPEPRLTGRLCRSLPGAGLGAGAGLSAGQEGLWHGGGTGWASAPEPEAGLPPFLRALSEDVGSRLSREGGRTRENWALWITLSF